MNRNLLKEILAAHADHLVQGKATGRDYLNLVSDDEGELAPLLSVAERLQSTLAPISLPNHFERDLKQELLNVAHQHQIEGYSPPDPYRDLLYFLLTAAFFVSLSMVLVMMRRRGLTLRQFRSR